MKFLEKDTESRIFQNDIDMLINTADMLAKFTKSFEAHILYQEGLDLVIANGHDYVFNLTDYIQIMIKLKKFQKCIDTLEKLVLKDSGYKFYLAIAYKEMKEFSKSKSILTESPSKTSKILLALIEIAYETKDYDEAFKLGLDLTNHTKKAKFYIEGMFWLGLVQLDLNGLPEGYKYFILMSTRILMAFKSDKPYDLKNVVSRMVNKMSEVVETKQVTEGEKRAKSAMEVERVNLPDYLSTCYEKAFENAEKHQYIQSLIYVNCCKLFWMCDNIKPMRQCPDFILCTLTYDTYESLEMFDEALETLKIFRKSLDFSNEDVEFKMAFQSTFMQKALNMVSILKYYDEATEIFELTQSSKSESLGLNNTVKVCTQARNLYLAQRHKESIEMFKTSYVKTCKEGIGFLWRPAMSHIHLGNYNKAMDALNFYERGIRDGTQVLYVDVKILIIRGNIYRKMKKYKQAMECFNSVKDILPYPTIPFYKMLTSFQKGNFKDYTKFMRQLIHGLKSFNLLMKFLRFMVFSEERYLANEWQKIMDIFVLRSRDFLPHQQRDVRRLRINRNSSLVALHFVKKTVNALNSK